MMHDRHGSKLADYYKETLARVRAHLSSKFAVEFEHGDDKDSLHVLQLNPNSIVWRVKVPGKNRLFTLLAAIPATFPDSLPKFYLTESDYFGFGLIPHVDKNHFVCTRDPEVVILNDICPEKAFVELLEVAVNTLEAGLKGKLSQDFQDEFLAYWNDVAESRALMTCTIPEMPCVLVMCRVRPPLLQALHVVAQSKSSAISWLTRLGAHRDFVSTEEVLCLRLSRVPDLVPETNGDVKAIIDGLDSDGVKSIKYFRGDAILGCIPCADDCMLVLWQHPLVQVNGFRKRRGSTPLYLRISNRKTESVKIMRWHVRRFDRIRLIKRAVDMGFIGRNDVRLAIVGCGSVGSVLAMLLAKSGCGHFTLVDPENLTEENVVRHLCGCSAVATTPKKVEAIKSALEAHLPFVNCDISDQNVLNVLIDTPQMFDEVNLAIVATGNMSTERRVNDFFIRDASKPVVYLWLEPYGVAGHVLYISPNQGGCYRCCFAADGKFIFSVAHDSQQFGKREAGCQQTFTPYGAADVTMFCAVACKEILDALEEPPDRSVLTTWIGDVEQFQSAGYTIKDDYRAHASYSIHRREVLRQETCKLCKSRD